MQINVITAGIFEAKWAHMSLFVMSYDKFISFLMYKLINLWDVVGGEEDAVVGHHRA